MSEKTEITFMQTRLASEEWHLPKTILYTGRCRKNATVSESFDCQEEERIDLLPEVTDKRWRPAFFHALYLLSIKLSMFCNLEYDMYVMKILITNSNSFYIMKI